MRATSICFSGSFPSDLVVMALSKGSAVLMNVLYRCQLYMSFLMLPLLSVKVGLRLDS